jgi:hypothetical protein
LICKERFTCLAALELKSDLKINQSMKMYGVINYLAIQYIINAAKPMDSTIPISPEITMLLLILII